MPAQRLIWLVLLTLLNFGPGWAHAEVSLNDSRLWRRAKLVPNGQQAFSFGASHQEFNERFGPTGSYQPLGQAYGRTLRWKQLIAADPNGAAVMQEYMSQHTLNGNDIAASANYQVQRQETTLAMDWAYGLTGRWMIGFQIPMTYRRTRVTSQVELTPALALGATTTRAPAKTAGQKSMLDLTQRQIQQKVSALANDQLRDSGYDGVPEQKTSWDWGDINLLSQVEIVSTYHWVWAMQQMVRLPTARNPNVADYVQTNSDDGQVDLGLTSMLDYRQKRLVGGLRVGYVAQLPDSVRVHVPGDPKQIDPSVPRDLGDYGWAALDSEYRVTRRLGVDVEYSYLKKAADRFKGTASDGSDYTLLGQNTDQELHQTRAGFVYRLGETSTRSGIENKWVASLDYTYPFIGRNSVDASRTSIQLISYF